MRHAFAAFLLLLAPLPAAARHCEIDGEQVNPDNGSTTAGKTGVLVCRQDDGSPMYEHELRDGKHVGMEKSWGYDGSRTERSVNANGNSEGLAREFWPNGTKKAEGEYRDGDAVGVQRRWHANGRLASVSFVPEAGQRASARMEYDDAGALTDFACAPSSVLDEDAKLCGYGAPVTVELYSRGRVAGRRTMQDGALVRDEALDQAGRVVESLELTRTGRVEKRFHPDGRPASEKTVANDWVVSEREWYMNGATKMQKTVDASDARNPRIVVQYHRDDGTLHTRDEALGERKVKRELYDAAGKRSEEFLFAADGTVNRHRKFAPDGSVVLEEEVFPDGSRRQVGAEAATVGGAP